MPAVDRYDEDPDIRRMRVRAWFNAVVATSGKVAAALEREFSGASPRRGVRSCIWQKYKQGLVVPRCGRHPSGELNLVGRVERAYPGTAKWLLSPLWRLADKAPLDMVQLRSIFESMPARIRSYFVLGAHEAEATRIFWRRPVSIEKTRDILEHFGTIDDFIAVLALIREAEVAQDRDRYSYWVTVAANWADARSPDLGLPGGAETAEELFDYLYDSWELEEEDGEET